MTGKKTKDEMRQQIAQAEPDMAEFAREFGATLISHFVNGRYVVDSQAGRAYRALVAKNQARIEADRKIERNHFRLVRP